MVNVEEIEQLTPKQLEEIQSVMRLFHLMGLTNDDITSLAQILKEWPTYVKNMNEMGADLVRIKRILSEQSGKNGVIDSEDALRKAVGFDNNAENVRFGYGGDTK